MKEFLRLPLRFDQFFENKKLPSCGLTDSVYRNLHLIITTASGESKSDPQFGSAFWETDYDIHLDNEHRKEIVINSLKKQIAAYEKRITNVQIAVDVKQAILKIQGGSVPRRKIEIMIKGQLRRTMEPFHFQTGLFIGPLTLD